MTSSSQLNIMSSVQIEQSWPVVLQTIETFYSNSSTGKSLAPIKVLFPWQLTLFHSPPTVFQCASDFELKNC